MTSSPNPTSEPAPTVALPYTPRQSRTIGALLGVHAGDSLGATVEFRTRQQIASSFPAGLRDIIGGGPFDWPAGHATDDTDMTRCVLLAYKALHDSAGQDQPEKRDVARIAGDFFIDWLEGNWPDRTPGSVPKDMGSATARGLAKYRRTRDPNLAGAGQGSAGNGSLMRCIPTALFQPDLERALQETTAIGRITHDDSRCIVSCAAYNSIAAALVSGASVDYAIRAGEATAIRLERGRDGEVYQAIREGRTLKIEDLARNGTNMKGECSGYVIETLMLAVAAVVDTRALEDVLVDVVRIGRDTDTNAAVAGGLLGARDGVGAIPTRWLEKLQFGDEFREVAMLLTTGLEG